MVVVDGRGLARRLALRPREGKSESESEVALCLLRRGSPERASLGRSMVTFYLEGRQDIGKGVLAETNGCMCRVFFKFGF